MEYYNNKYIYNNLVQVNNDDGTRHYETPHGNAPSVTTIISATTDKQFLEDWRNRIGDKKADEIVNISSTIGTHMHNSIEHWLKHEPDVKGTNIIRKQARKLAQILIEKGLKNQLNEFWGSEVMLNYYDLYAGTVDLVGLYDNTPAIIDFKNTRKPKKDEYITNYKYQLTAYGMAHNHLHNTKIKKGVILMMSREPEHFGTFQRFIVEGEDWETHEYGWAKKVEEYHKKYLTK